MPVEYYITEVREAFAANPRSWKLCDNYPPECGKHCYIDRIEKITENGIEYIVGYERDTEFNPGATLFKMPAGAAHVIYSQYPPFKPSL